MTVRGFVGRMGSDIGILEGEPGNLTIRPGPPTVSPNFLALSPDKKVLYAAVRDDDKGNAVGAWAIEGDELRPLGEPRITGSHAFCHLSVDPTGRYVLAAHMAGGTVTVHPIAADGSVEAPSDLVSPEGEPQLHMALSHPSSEFVLVTDRNSDKVHRYRLADGRLQADGAVSVPAGKGPWHLAFHPSLGYAYVSHQQGASLSIIDLDAFELAGPIVDMDEGSMPGGIHVSDDGRFCYVVDQEHSRIEVFGVSSDGASLQHLHGVSSGGQLPRHFALAGNHLYVANRESGSIAQFVRDPESGEVTPSGDTLSTPEPMCVVIL